jgi:hypothetical protein
MQQSDPDKPRGPRLPKEEADPAHEEGARELADQATERLRARGFDDEQIRRWSESYIAQEGSGDVDGLIAWVARQETEAGTPPGQRRQEGR